MIVAFVKNFIKGYFTKFRNRKNNKFARGSYISADCILGGRNFFDKRSHLLKSKIGYGSYLGHDTEIVQSTIGKFTCIGPCVKVVYGNHPTSKFVSIHPAFYSIKKQIGISYVEKQLFEEETYVDSANKILVSIGNDVWIGSDVILLSGVKIGNGAIIAAGAVVVSDIPDYAIYGGVPAKFIKWRFSPKEIEFLNSVKWWEKDEDWLKNNSSLFSDISIMMEEFDA